MPNTASAKKRVRQGETRAMRNKNRRTAMRTQIRKLKELVESGDKAGAQAQLVDCYKRIDKVSQANIIHENNAANTKSRLTKLVNAM